MKLKEFGSLVKALRQNCTNDQGKPLSRNALSKLVHLTPHQLGRLERGERKYLDPQTLQLMANALNLNALERKEFLFAAIGFDEEIVSGIDEAEAQFASLFYALENTMMPAFIMDVYADMIAANSPLLKLWMLTPELLEYSRTVPAGQNVVNFIYSSQSGFREMIGPRWREYAMIEVLLFRRSSLRFRHSDYFQYLFQALLREKTFETDWLSSIATGEPETKTYIHYEYVHPSYGPLSYLITETIVNTGRDNLYLIVYNPMDEATVSLFGDLAEKDHFFVQRMASWPEKKMAQYQNIEKQQHD